MGVEPAVPTQYYLGNIAHLCLKPIVEPAEGLSLSPSPAAIQSSALPGESIEVKPALFKIHQEAVLKNIAPEKQFYVEYNPETQLYVAIEYLTPEGTTWWKTRLGNEAHMQFSKQIQSALLGATMPVPRAFQTDEESFEEKLGISFQDSTDTLPKYVREAEKISGLRHTSSMNTDADFESFVGEKSPLNSPLNQGYLSAWNGFVHNLEHTQRIPTWVAYVSSEPVERPLYKNKEFSVTSPTIKMAMTATVSESFYNPLGIYTSPIANAFDNDQGPKGLSMMLHGATARLMGNIHPNYKYMIVRPIASMSAIFKKSGIDLTESDGRTQKTDKPYIRCTKTFTESGLSSPIYIQDVLSDDEKVKFGESPFILVDPRTEDYYQIKSHWFSFHPFLGGVPRENFDSFPFVTVTREDLTKVRK